jgi:hypothetical protein
VNEASVHRFGEVRKSFPNNCNHEIRVCTVLQKSSFLYPKLETNTRGEKRGISVLNRNVVATSPLRKTSLLFKTRLSLVFSLSGAHFVPFLDLYFDDLNL